MSAMKKSWSDLMQPMFKSFDSHSITWHSPDETVSCLETARRLTRAKRLLTCAPSQKATATAMYVTAMATGKKYCLSVQYISAFLQGPPHACSHLYVEEYEGTYHTAEKCDPFPQGGFHLGRPHRGGEEGGTFKSRHSKQP